MKKVLIGLLLIIPMAIVAAVVLVTNVVLITPDITVASIAIVDPDFYQDVDSVSLYFDRPGMQYQLAALVLPKKATNKKVHWSIENSVSYDPEYEGDIATVDDNGNVTINWTGTFDVVAKTDDGGKTDRCRFEIKSDVARSAYIVYKDVKLGETPSIDITTDEIIRLEACAHPIDVDLEYVTWESSDKDKNVLSVDANGVVVPQGAGTATVTMKLKSKDFVSGSEKRVAPEIVRTVQITVRGGVFPTALKYVYTDSVSLSSIGGAEGSTLVKSQNATLESDVIVFSGKTGYAVLEKGGKTMTLRKVESETSIVFENADVIENSTVIVGKVPYKLNAIFAASGEKASGARYNSLNTDVATIDEKTGLITAISSGEVTFTAEFGGETISIDLHVRKPVIYFMLEKDAPQGIADECVYGNMYFEYSGEEMTGRLVPFRQIKVVAPEDLTGSENLSRFKWSVVSDGDIATIDENGVITFSEFEKGVRKNVKVIAEAMDSPYAGDSIKREYNFTVMYGVNVETADELTKAVNEEIDGKKYEVFMRNDITIRSIRYTESDTKNISGEKGEEIRTWCNAPLRLSTSLYGNGHTIDWKHRDYDDPTAKPNIMGSNILVMDGPEGKDAPRVLLRNVKIKSSELPKNNTFASKDFVGIGVETKGNVHVQYCVIENAMYCMRVGSYDNEEEAVKKGDFAETLIEGTIMSNSSKFTCFSWCIFKNQRVVMKNCVYGQAASPSVGFSSGDDNEEHTCNLDIQGILRIYNWKQDVDLDLVGGITNNDAIDKILKDVIQKGLQGKRYEHLFVKDSGVRYMHCGMLFSGLSQENRVTVTGALEENGFDHAEIKLNELVAEISPGAAIIVGNMHPVTFYGYTDESKTPVKHNSNLVHSQELYKLLRGE